MSLTRSVSRLVSQVDTDHLLQKYPMDNNSSRATYRRRCTPSQLLLGVLFWSSETILQSTGGVHCPELDKIVDTLNFFVEVVASFKASSGI